MEVTGQGFILKNTNRYILRSKSQHKKGIPKISANKLVQYSEHYIKMALFSICRTKRSEAYPYLSALNFI
jgi:hypothetical protein